MAFEIEFLSQTQNGCFTHLPVTRLMTALYRKKKPMGGGELA